MKIRLQKIIADAGLASRRQAERWIEEGRVRVNEQVVTRLGALADPYSDKIRVKGRVVSAPPEKAYFILNKPARTLTTMAEDKRKRRTVGDFAQQLPVRVFPVGRLDYNTQGLLLFTNDGDLAGKLIDPKYKVERVYRVKVRGAPNEKALNRLRKGIPLDKIPTAPIQVEVIRASGKNCFLEMKLVEGKNRHIKRVCEIIRHPVIKLDRTHFGPIDLTDLPLGVMRSLTRREIKALRECAKEPV